MPDRSPASGPGADPEEEVLLAESVGRALLVVPDRLGPEERVGLVLHDAFAVPVPVSGERITGYELVAAPERLRRLGLAALTGLRPP